MAKWKTVSISCKTSELLDKIKEQFGINKGFAIEKALEEKYGNLIKEDK